MDGIFSANSHVDHFGTPSKRIIYHPRRRAELSETVKVYLFQSVGNNHGLLTATRARHSRQWLSEPSSLPQTASLHALFSAGSTWFSVCKLWVPSDQTAHSHPVLQTASTNIPNYTEAPQERIPTRFGLSGGMRNTMEMFNYIYQPVKQERAGITNVLRWGRHGI